jgi:hypothetical protein
MAWVGSLKVDCGCGDIPIYPISFVFVGEDCV